MLYPPGLNVLIESYTSWISQMSMDTIHDMSGEIRWAQRQHTPNSDDAWWPSPLNFSTVMRWSLMRDRYPSYPIDSAHDAAALRFSLGFCLGWATLRFAEHVRTRHLSCARCRPRLGKQCHKPAIWEWFCMFVVSPINWWFGGWFINYCFTMFYHVLLTYSLLRELQQTSMMCSVALCPFHESFFFRSAVLEGNHPVPEATTGAGARHLQVGLGA